ncbi:MAG: hypothetical protein ACFFCW_20970 [Candidatus Hodarchaeota archaeon]
MLLEALHIPPQVLSQFLNALGYLDRLVTVVEAIKECVFKYRTVPYEEALILTNHYGG